MHRITAHWRSHPPLDMDSLGHKSKQKLLHVSACTDQVTEDMKTTENATEVGR